MKVLIIFGVGNSGKTSSIKQIYNDLMAAGAKEKYFDKDNKKDFLAILEYQDKIITINSAGDNDGEVANGLKELEKQLPKEKWDYHICASRTKGGSIKAIQKNFLPEERIWFDSFKLENPTDAHYQTQSQRVIDIIDALNCFRQPERIE